MNWWPQVFLRCRVHVTQECDKLSGVPRVADLAIETMTGRIVA